MFDAQSASSQGIIAAGEQVLVSIYNGKPGEVLDSLRYKRFCEKVPTNISHLQPQSLPPPSAAAKYHSLRAYFQVQQWKGSGEDELQPEQWGWKETEGGLMPIHTDLPPAPDELLRVIRHNCQSDCSSMRCTCNKHNVKCSPACGNCRGSGCMNSDFLECDEEIDDMDDNIDGCGV